MGTEEAIIRELIKRKMKVTAVESCTGGMVAAALTSVPGSSEVFQRSFVTYCDQAKHELAGVRKKTLKKYTAVSKKAAKEMAEGGAKAAKADCCLSVTGYAGPAAENGDPVGLVYIGCTVMGKTKVMECRFSGERQQIRQQAADTALQLLLKRLTEKK